jgi:hypothetical protein
VDAASLETLVGGPGLVDSLLGDVLIPCAGSSLRSLRHAGSLAAMALARGLLVKAEGAGPSLSALQRQAAAEGKVAATLARRVGDMAGTCRRASQAAPRCQGPHIAGVAPSHDDMDRDGYRIEEQQRYAPPRHEQHAQRPRT